MFNFFRIYRFYDINKCQLMIIHYYKMILYDVIGLCIFFFISYLGLYFNISGLRIFGGLLMFGCIGFALLDNIHLSFLKKHYKKLGGDFYGKKSSSGTTRFQ